jgi:hypothetical protein
MTTHVHYLNILMEHSKHSTPYLYLRILCFKSKEVFNYEKQNSFPNENTKIGHILSSIVFIIYIVLVLLLL